MSGSSVQNALDRIVGGKVEVETDTKQDFISTPTWLGRRPRYFFGTGNRGTGYYFDEPEEIPSLKKKRSVQIDERNNETRLFTRSSSALEDAEKAAAGSTVIELTSKGIQSATNALDKIFKKNAIQRAQFANEPHHYIDSELALHDQLGALSAVAANAQLFQHLVDNQTLMSNLNQLLSHENDDIAAVVVSLYLEWLDPALLDDDPALLRTLGALASNVLQDSWEIIVSNFPRFQEPDRNSGKTQDQTLQGIENSLSLMENLLELDLLINGGLIADIGQQSQSAASFMVKHTQIIPWFFQQIKNESADLDHRGRCMELLAFVAQREDVHTELPSWSELPIYKSSNVDEKKRKRESQMNGIEFLLQTIGTFRKRQPANDSETGLLENACMTLSSCIAFSSLNLSAFLEGQGIELVLRCLKERVHSGGSGLKLLDFFGGSAEHKTACEHLVEVGALKYVFPIFLGARIPRPTQSYAVSLKAKRAWLNMVETQSIRILYAFSRHLDDISPNEARDRFVTKFANDETKCDRLVELLLLYDEKSRRAEFNFFRSGVEDEVQEEETVQLAALDAKLNGGGDLLHRLGALCAFVSINSKRCHERIIAQLRLQQSGISLVKAALEEFISLLGEGHQRAQLENFLLNI